VDLVVYDDDEKRYVPWAVALVGVLLVALLTAGLTFLLTRQADAQDEQPVGGLTSPAPATQPTAGTVTAAPAEPPVTAAPAEPQVTAEPAEPAVTAAPAEPTPAPACLAALLRADAALERSVALDEALAAHTDIVDELLAERIDAQEALDRSLPVLTDGATERRRFEQELSAYSESREECPT
jgi:predicted lipid-binding transport protein (Tim44 family)